MVAALVQAELKEMMMKVVSLQVQLLREEFGVDLDGDLRLVGLPALLPSYPPNLDALPEFFISIAADVPWKEPAERAVKMAEVLLLLFKATVLTMSDVSDVLQCGATPAPSALTSRMRHTADTSTISALVQVSVNVRFTCHICKGLDNTD